MGNKPSRFVLRPQNPSNTTESKCSTGTTKSSATTTYSTSQTAENRQFQMLDGRRFLDASTKSSYLLPSDICENDRLQMQHNIIHTAFGETNVIAPVKKALVEGGKVLDIGCAQGIWLLEVANEFPKSTCVGIDIAPMFPSEVMPKNVDFHQVNVLEGLPFEDNTFDFVAIRMMHLGLREQEWTTVFVEVMRVTKPGGWVQVIEIHGLLFSSGPVTLEFNDKVRQIMALREINADIVPELDQRLKDTGFINVDKKIVSLPVGWGVQIGVMMGQNIVEVYASLKPIYMKVTGISDTEYEEKVELVKKEWPLHKTYCNFFGIIGKKPSGK